MMISKKHEGLDDNLKNYFRLLEASMNICIFICRFFIEAEVANELIELRRKQQVDVFLMP